MTPKLYPVIEVIHTFTGYRHYQTKVNGSLTCLPVGLPVAAGDSICVVPKGFSVALFATRQLTDS